MILTSEAYRRAIVGSPREMGILAVVDLSDPDEEILPVTCSGQAPWSRPEQLHDRNVDDPPRYAALEDGLCLLDGSFDLFPDDYQVPEHTGFAGDALCGLDGFFPQPYPWVQFNLRGVRVLQAVSLFFPSDSIFGYPLDFTLEVWSGAQLVHSQEFIDNTKTDLIVRNFTVYDPSAVKITVKRWSLPYRRVRLSAEVSGLYERWDTGNLYGFTVNLQGQFSCMSLPYGSADVAMDNSDRRLEPRNKGSLFQSIEERQGIDLFLWCRTDNGREHVPVGKYYQAGDGWKASTNDPVLKWHLVDIIGLIANRTFLAPDQLPTTLEGWLRALVGQLGVNFESRYHVDPDYAGKPVTANSRADVDRKKCGDILRWVCQATGTWPRADQKTGDLTAEPLWNQGNKYTLDNLEDHPAMRANESLAALIFRLSDGTEYVVSGNSTSSEETKTIINPFLHTTEQALAAARLILAQYGGNILELTGRGDPSSEIGDVDTVWLDESSAATARRMAQTFQFQDGVLQGCRSTLLQADGSYLWTEYVVILESRIFTVPAGVRQLRIVLGQGGQGGGLGADGWVKPFYNFQNSVSWGYGDPGQDGQGGAIWYGVIDCNEGQEFEVHLGAGGAPAEKAGVPGALGEHTTFGSYSSENGRVYENGYTDIANGQSFARTGVAAPIPGSGDGGKGGEGGEPGYGYLYKNEGDIGYRYKEVKPGGPGHPGVAGASGFVMVSWDKPEKEG